MGPHKCPSKLRNAVRRRHLHSTEPKPFSVVFKSLQELTNDRLVSEADLSRLLGTLRYLQSLKDARQQVEAEAASPQKQPGTQPGDQAESEAEAGSSNTGLGSCPVCHEALGNELVMLPCGHQLCCRCSMTLIDRAPSTSSPQVSHITLMAESNRKAARAAAHH